MDEIVERLRVLGVAPESDDITGYVRYAEYLEETEGRIRDLHALVIGVAAKFELVREHFPTAVHLACDDSVAAKFELTTPSLNAMNDAMSPKMHELRSLLEALDHQKSLV